jgi:hypothetical protein
MDAMKRSIPSLIAGVADVATKYVVVRTSGLEVNGKKILPRGGSKDSQKSLPAFKQAN